MSQMIFGGLPYRSNRVTKSMSLVMTKSAALRASKKICSSSALPNLKAPHWQRYNAKGLTDPSSNSGGQMGVQPDRHTARTGWSMRRLANTRQALRSSASKSGISAKICEASSPDAKRSKTSLTRIRIPRTQGRPPHCRGFTVIRFVKSCTPHTTTHFTPKSKPRLPTSQLALPGKAA